MYLVLSLEDQRTMKNSHSLQRDMNKHFFTVNKPFEKQCGMHMNRSYLHYLSRIFWAVNRRTQRKKYGNIFDINCHDFV
jgi:hypothetical protein